VLSAKENLLRASANSRVGAEWDGGRRLDRPSVIERCAAAGSDAFGVRWSYEALAGGGYIAAPSHTVPYDPALLAAMNDEIATYGRRCYARPARG
jgi:hypothetical protein